MTLQDSWRAVWEGHRLHGSGTTDLFPNDFSTASLERSDVLSDAATVAYRLGFHRDKEPFCDKDGVGPVHHVERSLPAVARRIRIVFPVDRGFVELDVPAMR
jgi:hypothetical protein